MTRFERNQLETRKHDSVMVKYFALFFVVAFAVILLLLPLYKDGPQSKAPASEPPVKATPKTESRLDRYMKEHNIKHSKYDKS